MSIAITKPTAARVPIGFRALPVPCCVGTVARLVTLPKVLETAEVGAARLCNLFVPTSCSTAASAWPVAVIVPVSNELAVQGTGITEVQVD